jgi:cytochrome oxidase Cu insertion factor (SCO1/SenC/PrrC family)
MRSNKKHILFFALFFAAQLIYGCKNGNSTESVNTKTSVADLMASLDIQHITKPISAQDFELPSVNGGKVSLSKYRGKVILLSFWSTW